ncbi:MAG: tRNA (N6-threonylcarbamoyladenosine(37)-N6)-methyltransferase TrmO [Clostridiales bacterium]|nr:tRNA (N6-threonylcarbamoyladenosine(37)-N6)-methyltransferase TrmO [Candidatus Blautia equi]
MKVIARIENDFPTKFGIPRQSHRMDVLKARIVMEPEYRVMDAFKGLEEFTHLWLIWEFSEAVREDWSPTVRPPRLGGNQRKGVFATRSPFRPNAIGLSCVKLDRIVWEEKLGPVLYISGADLMNGTPIYDIKPYLPYVDSHPEASGGFTDHIQYAKLEVQIPEEVRSLFPEEKQDALIAVLEEDPRPQYQKDPERIYGLSFAGFDIHFKIRENVLMVLDAVPLP